MTFAEEIAHSTWERLKRSRDYRVRLGEETLTDILILDLAGCKTSGRFRLHQPTKLEESQKGADLEIWIRVGQSSAVHFVIQAKKLGTTGRYDHLNPSPSRGKLRQIDRLEHHAQCVNAIPVYLFYNDVDNAEASLCWHCCKQKCDECQTGCTVVPSWRIRTALSHRGCRTFFGVHRIAGPRTGANQTGSALPWRCLFDCPSGIESILERLRSNHKLYSTRQSGTRFNEQYSWLRFMPKEDAWPQWLWSRDHTALLSQRDLSRLYSREVTNEIVDTKARLIGLEPYPTPRWLPKRILLADPSIENPVEAGERVGRQRT